MCIIVKILKFIYKTRILLKIFSNYHIFIDIYLLIDIYLFILTMFIMLYNCLIFENTDISHRFITSLLYHLYINILEK